MCVAKVDTYESSWVIWNSGHILFYEKKNFPPRDFSVGPKNKKSYTILHMFWSFFCVLGPVVKNSSGWNIFFDKSKVWDIGLLSNNAFMKYPPQSPLEGPGPPDVEKSFFQNLAKSKILGLFCLRAELAPSRGLWGGYLINKVAI